MGGRNRPMGRMRLSDESVKTEKHEKAVMFAGEHDGFYVGKPALVVTPAQARLHKHCRRGSCRTAGVYGFPPARE